MPEFQEENRQRVICGEHKCPPGECFELHYPEANVKKDFITTTPEYVAEAAVKEHEYRQRKNWTQEDFFKYVTNETSQNPT